MVRSLFNFDSVIDWQLLEGLSDSAGPADGCANWGLSFANAEEEFLSVLRQKSGSGLEIFCLAKTSSFDCNCGSDGVAVARLSVQAE